MSARTSVDEKLRLLLDLPARGRNFLTLTSLARLFGASARSARVIAWRYERKGVLERAGPGLYANLLAKPTIEELACLVFPPSYISFEYALRHHGLSTQIPAGLSCVTRRRARMVRTRWGVIRYHCFQPGLFFGFRRETLPGGRPVWLAEPEKALLDWAYLALRRGLDPEADELDLSGLDKARLARYAGKYPERERRRMRGVLGIDFDRLNVYT